MLGRKLFLSKRQTRIKLGTAGLTLTEYAPVFASEAKQSRGFVFFVFYRICLLLTSISQTNSENQGQSHWIASLRSQRRRKPKSKKNYIYANVLTARLCCEQRAERSRDFVFMPRLYGRSEATQASKLELSQVRRA